VNGLLVTDGFFHPPFGGRRALHRALAQLDGFSFHHVSSLEQLSAEVENYAALVLDNEGYVIPRGGIAREDVASELARFDEALAAAAREIESHRDSISRRLGISRQEAELLIDERQKERDRIIRTLLDADAHDPLYYHMTFNNTKIRNNRIARTIADFVLTPHHT